MEEFALKDLTPLCMLSGNESVIEPAKTVAAAQINEPQAPTHSPEGPSNG